MITLLLCKPIIIWAVVNLSPAILKIETSCHELYKKKILLGATVILVVLKAL